ncbi:tetratricopeptide repeat protein [Campylobacter sp. MIT 19-121]|uniref:tetratricopeptide repeat protein n=1 Tax=Campylobacter sp. MIT 19-121 TaxID=2703906 RepID=UPI001389B986|nr:tetratricopeptide repeat protein [Campylobacter sp. MIT 19-121]NDJ27606.1 tetratricopeptide repeat protein [Campylobacter sp. MIT 19-121]
MAEEEVILKEKEETSGGFSRSGGEENGSGFSRSGGEKQDDSSFEEAPREKKWYEDTKFVFMLAVLLGVVAILLVVLSFLSSQKSEPSGVIIPTTPQAPQASVDNESLQFDMSKMDSMIQKANALYLQGEREQALQAYEQIALYSEALSNYNLGVSQMNQNNYALALESFKKAIEGNENQTVSAINAAVCALHLNDIAKFQYYLDLAYVYLPNEGNSKLFNYYLSLINYYKGFYPEALQMLQLTNDESYVDNARYLSAKIYAKMGLDAKALENLQKQGNFESSLSQGLIYARMGDYARAKTALERSLKIDKERNQSIAALNLIDLKTGKYQDMLSRIRAFYQGAEKTTLDTYKIKVRLKKELFDIQIAQDNFSKDFLQDKKAQADFLFYFAPYQVFDTKQAANYINKANVVDFLEDKKDGIELLNASQMLSSVNVKLAKIISKVFESKLKEANNDFKTLLNSYQEHSILHYNLALSYAQLQNYDLAYKHFSSSYHLDPKNYAAGAFAVLTGNLSQKSTIRLVNEINENISVDDEFKANVYQNILLFANNDNAAMLPFLDDNTESSPLSFMLKSIIAKNNGLYNQMDAQLARLKNAAKDDILADILLFNAQNSNLNIKEYAQNAQLHFKNIELNYKALAGGANLIRENYINLMRVSGLLNQEREKIKEELALGMQDEAGLSAILAYMDIYAGLYAEAYALYDTLINDFNHKDSTTYFLAAVAAIGSNNPNAAIALLELAKLEDESNQEARVALGLLYQEVQNYEPALYHYGQVENNFQSRFFTFDLR